MPILLEGLRRLEYRGYDSAGVAVNAHPHVSGGVSVVHNGIIENHDAIRARLKGLGYEFASDTDTEVIAHLVHWHLKSGASLFQSLRNATRELVGAYAIAAIALDDPSRMVVARMGAPLLLGLGEGENFAASDTAALLQVTRRMIFLEEGDCAEVTPKSVRIVDARGCVVERPLHVSQLAADAVELGGWRHYMQKEISYIHAEAYAAGELKHGPLALVDRNMPVVAIAPKDALLDKLKSNLQEVRARGGELYVIANEGLAAGEGVRVARMHDDPGMLSPIVTTVPLQLLAYHAALLRGNDVDKPRNLAKSVTVE